ncbi:MAG: glycine--tRNA ligase [Candidatus Aenigmarchaeota archaeon]|nr:glycine--tRNA ligase [Candidatus Aenigmarchaeota archaeon]
MVTLENILDIAKRRGFFWQSCSIHGAVAGFYDYGHLGALLRNKWEDLWGKTFLGLDDNFYEIKTSVIMPEAVFKASGHLANFTDPIAKCKKCGNVMRADHIIEDVLKESFEGITPEGLTELIKKHNIKCSKCKSSLENVESFNMMFPLDVGAGKSTQRCYPSAETAQQAYVNFKQEFEALRRRLPMGLAIIGKAFRNEIAPRNALIRMREFTQAELQIFFDPDTINEHPDFSKVQNYKLSILPAKGKKIVEINCKDALTKLKLPKFYVYHMAFVQKFYTDILGFPKEKFRFRELSEEERAFYNRYHFDIELDLESLGGFKELGGIHYRTDHDLKGHQEVSGEKMEVNIEGKKILPHVLELSFGVDRNMYALFELAYVEEKERTVLKFPRIVSPYDVAVFPLVNKEKMPEKARDVQKLLADAGFVVFYDSSASIGRRYRRMDEIGCPAGITIDGDTIKNNSVTIRDRDTMKQIRIKIKDLPEILKSFLSGEKIEKLGKLV